MTFSHVTSYFKKPTTKTLLIALGGIIAGLVIFQAGIFVGFHKANYGMMNNATYYRPLLDKHAMPWGMSNDEFTGGHSAIGKVIKIELPRIVVSTPDNVEKVIMVGSSTTIRRFRDNVTAQDIKIDDYIVSLGAPSGSAEISAKLIRILPPPESTTN